MAIPQTQVPVNYLTCPSGHFTHSFLACDLPSQCWLTGVASSSDCHVTVTSFPSPFRCGDGVGDVPFSLVCDYRRDCQDDSDESFCVFAACARGQDFQCQNGQCVPRDTACDGQKRCLDNSHVSECIWAPQWRKNTAPPPQLVDMIPMGKLTVRESYRSAFPNGSVLCPDTHFRCSITHYYLLPVYLRCNGVIDCPHHEDEAGCQDYICPGFYRCRASRICAHPTHLCDGYFQCPQHDDELFCDLHCLNSCTCYGLSWTCTSSITVSAVPELRYLDARNTFMTFADVMNNTMLIYLSLASCHLTCLPKLRFMNLHILDLSDNFIRVLNGSHLCEIPNLKMLSLSNNQLTVLFPGHNRLLAFNLLALDLSRSVIRDLDVHNLTMFPSLQMLNLSDSGVESVSSDGFQPLSRLQVLDVRGCPMSVFQRGILTDLQELRLLYADNYKLCCPSVLPTAFHSANCRAPYDEVSSCDSLLRSDFFRLFLYVFAAMALFGNAGSFLYRTVVSKTRNSQGFGIFVSHLCVSDFLMGTYLAVIGIADRIYQGSYLWEDVAWRYSKACKTAGFLSLLSSEVSAFTICLITLDRFLVLRFPFSKIRFQKTSAQKACFSLWMMGVLLGMVPLLPATRQWEFYGQTGICIPLPLTHRYFEGLPYSLATMIVLNSVLFLLIALGQCFIYQSIRMNSISIVDTSKSTSKDLTIARRLITIVMTDFLCWFPVGIVAVLASCDVPIPGEVNVGMAIFVLPLNSALNPFLYTLNVIQEKRERAQFKRLQALFQSRTQFKRSFLKN